MDVNELLKTMGKTADSVAKLMRYEQNLKVLMQFAFAYLSDMYVQNTEALMKEQKADEAGFFAARATEARRVAGLVFGGLPEKNYYSNLYKIPKGVPVGLSEDDFNEFAAFCVNNMRVDEEILSNVKKLRVEITKKLKALPHRGFFRAYAGVLREDYNKGFENPEKLAQVYELLVLAETVLEVSSSLKKLTPAGRQEMAAGK